MKDRKERGRKRNRRAVCLSSRISAAVSLCLILSLFLTPLTVHATAGEVPDITGDKKYSIRVMMVYDDKTVEGGSFESFRVGEIVKLNYFSKEAASQGVETAGDTYRFWPTDALIKSMGYDQEEIDRINGINKDEPDALSKLNAILDEKLNGSELNGIGTAAQKEKLAKTLAAYVKSPSDQGQETEEGGESTAAIGDSGGRAGDAGEGTGSSGENAAAVGDSGEGAGGTGEDTGDGGSDDGQETPDLWGDDHVIRENENGEVVFEDLRTGLYLFTQSEEQASPGYYPVEPFLVSVPIYDSEYNYNVQAFPNEHEVKIYVKFRLLAKPKDPPDTPVPPGPDPDPDPPGPDPDPDPDPPPEPEPDPWIPIPFFVEEPKARPRLPQTGQMNWPVPVLAVSGAVMFLAGMCLRLYGRKGSEEKSGTEKEVP